VTRTAGDKGHERCKSSADRAGGVAAVRSVPAAFHGAAARAPQRRCLLSCGCGTFRRNGGHRRLHNGGDPHRFCHQSLDAPAQSAHAESRGIGGQHRGQRRDSGPRHRLCRAADQIRHRSFRRAADPRRRLAALHHHARRLQHRHRPVRLERPALRVCRRARAPGYCCRFRSAIPPTTATPAWC